MSQFWKILIHLHPGKVPFGKYTLQQRTNIKNDFHDLPLLFQMDSEPGIACIMFRTLGESPAVLFLRLQVSGNIAQANLIVV